MTSTDAIRAHFDERACCRARRRRPRRLERSSRRLLDVLDPEEITGRAVLDVGCGYGTLARECLRRGASQVTGVDLSPRTVAEAQRQTAELGMAARASFVAADGASAVLEHHDLVVLAKVICCFFDPHALVTNTLAAADRTYAVCLPVDNGVRGLFNRTFTRLENAGQAVRGCGMRSYIHPIGPIDATIRRGGFEPASLRRAGIWELRVYRRRQAA